MALSTSATVRIDISYNQTDLLNVGTIVKDLAQTGFFTQLSSNNSGSSGNNPLQTGVVSFVYTNRFPIPSGTTLNLNLTSLTRTYLNSLITTTLESGRLKALYTFNDSNSYIHLKTTGSSPFNEWNGLGTGGIVVQPRSPFMILGTVSGFEVTSSRKNLHFSNMGASGNLDIVLLGVARTGT